MKTLGSLAVVVLAVYSAHGGDEAALKKVRAALEGKWKVVSMETFKGKDEGAVGSTFEFDKEGRYVWVTGKGNQLLKKARFKLNPGRKEIDIDPDNETRTYEGIYAIEKDKLTICLALNASDGRPTEFAIKDGKNHAVIKLERAK